MSETKPYLVETGPGEAVLTICTPEKVLLRLELSDIELVQFFEVIAKAILHRVRKRP